MDTQEIISPREAARRLSVSVKTVLRWVRDRRVPSLLAGPRLIRLPWADLLVALRQTVAS